MIQANAKIVAHCRLALFLGVVAPMFWSALFFGA
jgi:hypothetical protein